MPLGTQSPPGRVGQASILRAQAKTLLKASRVVRNAETIESAVAKLLAIRQEVLRRARELEAQS